MKGREPCWGVEVDSRGPGSLLTGGQLQQAFLLLQPITRHLLKPDGADCEQHAWASTSASPPGSARRRDRLLPRLTPWITFNYAADKVLVHVQLAR